jgi:hypothetical protein
MSSKKLQAKFRSSGIWQFKILKSIGPTKEVSRVPSGIPGNRGGLLNAVVNGSTERSDSAPGSRKAPQETVDRDPIG